MGADFPLILAGATGRDPATVLLLSTLAATLGVGVLNVCGAHVNIPYSDPHSLGHATVAKLPHIPDADVLLLLDPEIPWVDVADNKPRDGAVRAGSAATPGAAAGRTPGRCAPDTRVAAVV